MVKEVEREFKTKVIVIGQKLDDLKNNKKGVRNNKTGFGKKN